MTQLRAGNPKLSFCIHCQKEQPTVKGYVLPDLRRKRRLCLICQKPVEAISKFNNVPRRCALGKLHQSTLEAAHCDKVHLMQKAGLVHDVEAHPQHRFALVVNGVDITTYVADFVWHENPDGRGDRIVVADSKGRPTSEYLLKRRLMKACLGIEILELGSRW